MAENESKTTTTTTTTTTTEDTGVDVNKVKSAVVCDDSWKIQVSNEIEETGLKLLQLLQKYSKEREEEEMISDSNDKLINYMKPISDLWSKKLEEEERELLQEGWTHLKDALLGTGLEECHRRLLLSIQQHHGLGGEKEILKFATVSPHGGGVTNVRRLALQRPGPYGLPRQAVMGVVCITTKDAFQLYNPTTGDTSPWIETTTTQRGKGKPRRRVESIALGYDTGFCCNQHKVICISSYVKKQRTEDEYLDDSLVVEVLTVQDHTWVTGEHEWKKLEFPPKATIKGDRLVLVDGPLYMDGKLHWQCHYEREWATILEYNIFTEDFVHIPLHRFLIQEYMDSSRHVRSILMEDNGKLAILKSTSNQETSSLWVCHSSSRRDQDSFEVKWTKEEELPIPYAYYASPGFSVEALKFTDLIFIHSRRRISYYDRKTKVSLLSLRIPASHVRDHFDLGRMTQM